MKVKNLLSKKGFTLVELVVVVAIVGILASVLIPSIVGYIDKAEESAAEQEANPYITAYQSWLVEKDQLGYNVEVAYKLVSGDIQSGKTYYTYDSSKGKYVVVENPSNDDKDGLLEVLVPGKGFKEYCENELGMNVLGELSLEGTIKNSTGFTYVNKTKTYEVEYNSKEGTLEAVKAE